VDWTTGDLAVSNLATDENFRVTDKGPFYKAVEYAEAFRRFSEDGQQLAYIWDRNGYELWVINLDGSNPRFIYRDPPEFGEMVRTFDWSADGKYVAAIVPKPGSSTTEVTLQIALIHVDDGTVQGLKTWDGPVSKEQRMSFSPDGRFLAYDFAVNGDTQNRDIFVLGTGDSQVKALITHPADDRLLDWSPDGGAILFASDRAGSMDVWLQSLDDGAPLGAAKQVMENFQKDIQPLGFTHGGDYFFGKRDDSGHDVYTASLDLEQGIVSDPPVLLSRNTGFNEAPEWSPDGKSIAYIHQGRNIVIRSIESGAEQSFAPRTMESIWTVGGYSRYLSWSPDGQQFIAPEDRVLNLVDVETGVAIPAVTGRRSRFGRWSADGKEMFYVRQPGLNDGIVQIVRMDMETQGQKVLYNSELRGENLNSFESSPDGEWLAFSDLVSAPGTDDVETVLMVLPAGGGEPRLLLRIADSKLLNVVGWTPNSREILYTQDSKLAANRSSILWRISIDGGAPRKLELGLNVLNVIRFHPDGQRVAFDSGQRGAQIWVMEDVLSVLKSGK
jgi:Tol biopolymer transport system component